MRPQGQDERRHVEVWESKRIASIRRVAPSCVGARGRIQLIEFGHYRFRVGANGLSQLTIKPRSRGSALCRNKGQTSPE